VIIGDFRAAVHAREDILDVVCAAASEQAGRRHRPRPLEAHAISYPRAAISHANWEPQSRKPST
jgi:hypothetical protein